MAEKQKRHWLLRAALRVLIIYLLLTAGLFVLQRRMIYFPSSMLAGTASAVASQYSLEPWLTKPGEFIGWKYLAKNPGPHDRVLITHGNAGSAVDRADYVGSLREVIDCDVFILEYPGFGPRPGSPSQSSLFTAGDEAIGLLGTEGKLYVIGESLGTGLAAYLAGKHPNVVNGLLLIAPYENLGDVAQSHMPIFPAKWILFDKFTSGAYLRQYHGPLAVLLAGNDTVVPNKFGRRLYDEYRGRKNVWEVPGASHNDLPNQPVAWWKEVVNFWREGT